MFITVRDRLEPLRRLVAWLESAGGVDITLVDNDSAYPPLLEWLDASPHSVVRTGSNLGPRVAWITGLVQEVGLEVPYVVTDPDVVPDPGCPHDLVDHLGRILADHPELDRVGPALRIDDLPAQAAHTAAVVSWEAKFWRNRIADGLYAADIDTTFALYRPGRRAPGGGSARTGPPYVARHLPWYQVGPPDEELAFYRARADPTVNSWDLEQLPPYLQRLIDAEAAHEANGRTNHGPVTGPSS